MDFSKLKIEVYDFLGIVLPGLLAICEGWILFKGWHPFVASINLISGTSLTLLFVLAFGMGHTRRSRSFIPIFNATTD